MLPVVLIFILPSEESLKAFASDFPALTRHRASEPTLQNEEAKIQDRSPLMLIWSK